MDTNNADILKARMTERLEVFARTGGTDDLKLVIEAMQPLAESKSDDSEDLSMSLYMASAMLAERTGSIDDLTRAITAAGKVFSLSVTTPATPVLLSLSAFLHTLCLPHQHAADLDAAVDMGMSLVGVLAPGDQQFQQVLSDVSILLWTRFEKLGFIGDVDQAIRLSQKASDSNPSADNLYRLCLQFSSRWEHTHSHDDLVEAIKSAKTGMRRRPCARSSRQSGIMEHSWVFSVCCWFIVMCKPMMQRTSRTR
jgi:hypothetical protein